MAKKVQLQTNGKEWQVIDGEQVLVDVPKQDIDPITSSSCVQIEGFRTLEEAVSDNKMLSQDLTYTKVMDKVGGDYHQNVLDGQYSKAILYGNTQVNLCEEDSSNALQIPTTFTSFNNGELQIKNKESQVVAPLIKGVTMVNLAQINSSSVASGKGVPIQNVKGNTVYTLSFTFTTKNTNSGVVIECYDVNGEYLGNVMHKTGLGDDVKFIFTTHANATKIHICNNAAYGGETIQLDEIMLIEGDQTSLDIPFFKGMRSVELSKPLTNLFSNDLVMVSLYSGTGTNSNGTVTSTSTNVQAWAGLAFSFTTLKPNTKYLVMWDGLSTTQTSTSNTEVLIGIYHHDGTTTTRLGTINNNSLCPTKRSIIFDTQNYNTNEISLRVHSTLNNTETATTTVTGLRVFEYDDYLRSVDLQSIGWFSGTKNVAVEPIKTCSKNLYPYGDINFTPTSTGWFDAKGNGNMYGDVAQKSKCRFLLKKGTYCLSMGEGTNISSVQLINDKEEMLSYTPLVLEQDTYLTMRVNATQPNVATTLTNIQIERGETVTGYVAHDSRYYEHNGQNAIVLRSLPSGVCDTFNLQTGEYTRRIGEVIFNGTENQSSWEYNEINGTYRIQVDNAYTIPYMSDRDKILVLSDKLKAIKYNVDWDSGTFVSLALGRKIVIRIDGITDATDLVNYLTQNPITVQYQLDTPITTIIPRTIKRNNNGTVSTVDFGTYTNKENFRLPKNPSYLTINSMTSIKPVVEPITYFDFKTRLKANTDYSVIIDKNSTDKTINLGGTSKTYIDKMLVRTPSIDLEQNLRISGNGSIQNIMVIEGDVLDKELPYFNGMCNVKMPIIRNMGRNLLDNNNVRVTYDTNIILRAYPTFPCKPGKRYVYCVDKFGAESSCNWYSCKRDAVLVNGSETTGIIEYLGYSTSVVAPPDCKYLCIYSGGSTNLDPYSIHAYVYEVDTLAEAQAIGYTDYKENQICLVQGEIGLSQDMFEQGGFSGVVGNTYDNCKATNTSVRTRTKGLISVKPNSTYIINNTTTNLNHVFYFFDEKQTYLGQQTVVNIPSFITPNNCRYMSLMFSKGNNSNILVSDLNFDQFQLLELDSTVQLRSLPNGVKDELNLLTGEYIQRVGEVVIDGSEEWVLRSSNNYIIQAPFNGGAKDGAYLITDSSVEGVAGSYITGDYTNHANKIGFTEGFVVYDSYTTPFNGNINKWKNYLQQSPITVQYELAEPIISYPRIVSNTQEREIGVKLPNGICDTYNPSTGITVKRVGKAILDGRQTMSNHNQANWMNDSVYGVKIKPPIDIALMTETSDGSGVYNMFTDSLPMIWSKGVFGANKEGIGLYNADKIFYMSISRTKLQTQDLEGVKSYLASNPITVWYELANPIVTTDIVLPNGVHDEYNPLTGLYTKRVGFIELDGSEDWILDTTKTNTQVFELRMVDITTETANNLVCDKLPISDGSLSDTEKVATSNLVSSIYIALLKTKASTLNELKTYLSQNPIKVWYELSTPITYQLTPYFGLPMPYAYKDGYLIMDSAYDGQTLPPEITYQLTVNRTGQITQNNIKLKEHTDRLSNLEYMLIEATLDSIFSREVQNFELELMNIELLDLDE